jgi:hypothetical protein
MKTQVRTSLVNKGACVSSDQPKRADSESQCSCLLLLLKLNVCVLWVWFSDSQFSTPRRSEAREAVWKNLMSTMTTWLAQSSSTKYRNCNITLQAPNQFPRHLGLSLIYTRPTCMTSDNNNFVVVYLRVWRTVQRKTKGRKHDCKATNTTRSNIIGGEEAATVVCVLHSRGSQKLRCQ